MVGTKCKHNAEAAGGPERHEQIDKRSTLFFSGFGQKLLELIDDQQSFRVADWQIAADRVTRLARICRIDAPAQGRALVCGSPESVGSFRDASLEGLDRIPARAHDDHVP